MAYYPHPEGSPARSPQTGIRERAQARWWHTRTGVIAMAGVLALIALVTGGLLQLSHTAQAWWLAERTAALQHEMEVQAHGRQAELELGKQRVAFHLGYVGMAMDRSRSDAERLSVLRLLDGFDGDPDVQRWAHVELGETEARLAAGLGRPGVADMAALDVLPDDEAPALELDAADEGAEGAEAEVAEAPAEAVDTEQAAAEVRAAAVSATQGGAEVRLFNVHEVRPAAARDEVAIAVATVEPSAAAPRPPVTAAPVAQAPPASPTAPRAEPRPATEPARAGAADRAARPRPAASPSTVVNGGDRRSGCAPGTVRMLRRVGEYGPSCGSGPRAGQQALLTGTRLEWISYGDPSDKSSFVECSCGANE
jgi:hypothetical protein